MPYIETPEEFIARHGGNPVMIEQGVYALPDGAVYSDRGMGLHCQEPHPNPLTRLQVRRRYHATLLEKYEKAFGRLKSALLGERDRNGPVLFQWSVHEYGPPLRDAPGDPPGTAGLHWLRQLAVEQRERVRDIDSEIEAHPQTKAAKEAQAAAAESDRRVQEQRAQQITRIAQITL
jgi:hypothetical protein